MSNDLWHLTFEVALSRHGQRGGQFHLGGQTLTLHLHFAIGHVGPVLSDIQSQHCQPKFCPIPVCLPFLNLLSFNIFLIGNSSVLQTAHIRLLQPPYVHRWDVLMEPSGLGQNTALFFWFTPHYLKKWTNEWLTQWQKSPVFPCGVHLCASGISVSFPTAMCVWIILHCINPVLAVIFFQPRCIKMRTAAKCYPCVVSLYFALDAKRVNRPTGFFKWRPFRADQKVEIGAVACVCFCVCFRIIKLFKMSRDSCVKSWVYLMNVLKSRLKAVLVVQFMTFIVAVC